MGITARQILAIVVIAYYLPALFLSIFICFRHGVGKLMGWALLVLFCIMSIAGASLQIALDTQPPRNPGEEPSGLEKATKAFVAMGLVPLLMVVQEFLTRVKDRLRGADPIDPRAWRIIAGMQSTEAILGIISFAINSKEMIKATVIIIAILFGAQVYIALLFFLRRRDYYGSDTKTPNNVLISIPFLTVRCVYEVGYGYTYGSFAGIVGSALMRYLMEFVVVALYLYTAWKIQPEEKKLDQESDLLEEDTQYRQ
ncbi:hypothetical protein BS50DRAFT_625363 [Corynespora cassiicola Philippines]|uniref:DUF7702 domain-containing protein n=1 Tax=Corynespora cassiicola Philippines TaxID=1448308 RepID=A0A2T2N7W4_CORCC|nr:hypothetical protein BS50DRAFT_625363 [Corynespora cassiicola Philippines]